MDDAAGFRELEAVLPYREYGRRFFREPAVLHTEWLVTNGIGGYCSATLAGALTRRYHGLLVAALSPPLQRTLLLSRLDETASYLDQTYPLFTNVWSNGSVDPQGHNHAERFFLRGSIPAWDYRLADALLRKRLWMPQGANTTYITYTLLEGSAPLELVVKALVNFRRHHDTAQRPKNKIAVQVASGRIHLGPEKGQPFRILAREGECTPIARWFRDYFYPIEARRGLEALDDHLYAAEIKFAIQPGQEASIIATAELDEPIAPAESLLERVQYEVKLLDQAQNLWKIPSLYAKLPDQTNRIKQLVLAADQFVVARPVPGQPVGKTVIAGYPWFSDWGRDTMISLPGLAIATGRPQLARRIIETFAHFIDRGMLPNRFPSANVNPEYNTVDATLWYFYAIHTYLEATHDIDLLEKIYPKLVDIIDWHISGTRYGIQVDPIDYLLAAGETGVQLTWMDAKVGDWVVTPRIGKPVEINALWFNAIKFMHVFAARLSEPVQRYEDYSHKIAQSFQKFWIPAKGYLYDVIDGPDGHDDSMRPNQLFAISLPHSPLNSEQQKSIVQICARKLYTSSGLRSLAYDDPDYIGSYGGNQKQRDAAYHQGAAWGWLVGPFITAWKQAYNDPERAEALLLPILQQLDDHCLGNLSEIFEGQPPHEPRGCFAQAWTVAEVLWSWYQLHRKPQSA